MIQRTKNLDQRRRATFPFRHAISIQLLEFAELTPSLPPQLRDFGELGISYWCSHFSNTQLKTNFENHVATLFGFENRIAICEITFPLVKVLVDFVTRS